ncbi:MAG: dihydroorotate dehydrogenase electron transfer subunit, partial [Lachnospiraceae bacterium]|nr:dihydroorotate dehydrogenase electron transfer subunit [Lachnospiraceae bacterium]
MSKVKMDAVIISQERIAEGIYSMWFEAVPIAKEAKAGQFVAVYSDNGANLLPRPISICEIDRDN